MLLLYSQVAQLRGDEELARSCALDALAEARNSGPYFVLKCSAALCELPGAGDEDFDALRQAYAAFPEGQDTPFVRRVARLLKH